MTEPQGGYFVWLELPLGVNALDIHHQAMAQSISTAPGVLFSADRRFTRHLRLNVGHPVNSQIRAALKLLGGMAKDLEMLQINHNKLSNFVRTHVKTDQDEGGNGGGDDQSPLSTHLQKSLSKLGR